MAKVDEREKIAQEPAWHELTKGGLMVNPGSAEEYKTGDWRTERPIWNGEKCISCMLCWMYCPDASIKIVDGKVAGIDYDHCKGCGICAAECPPKVKAIEMKPEADFRS
jgi:pyruvate ferredoxin oxidoreductase delta subunit